MQEAGECLSWCGERLVPTLSFFVPGIGIISSPCPRSHASATWPADALWRTPISFKPSASLFTLGKFSAENLDSRKFRSCNGDRAALTGDTAALRRQPQSRRGSSGVKIISAGLFSEASGEVLTYVLASQNTLPERREWHNGDAELSRRGE